MAEIKARFPDDAIEFEVVPGGRGVFDIDLDGARVYSKHAQGRFPRYGEVPNLMLRLM